MGLVEDLTKGGWLKTPRIIKAFRKIQRDDFLSEKSKDLAELNEALPIGYGQTISQPLVVAFMLELLEPKAGDKVLDIGAGSGWTSALIADIVGEQGKVVAIELVPELAEFGRKNIAKYNYIKKGIVQFVCADGSKGYNQEAPFDKILCSAASQKKEVPKAWQEQLKTNGSIVTPIGSSIWHFKKKDKDFESTEYPGFAFVPLIEQ